MITAIQPSKVLILLVAACLVWVGLISLVYVILSSIDFSTAWIAVGSVFFAAMAWVLVMFREIQSSAK